MPSTLQISSSRRKSGPARRDALVGAAGLVSAMGLSAVTLGADAEPEKRANFHDQKTGAKSMTTINTKDGTEIFYKDQGPKDAQPIMFHHGWPLSSDDWDAQMLFFVQHERARKVGGTTLRSVGHVTRLQRVLDNDADYVTPIDMLAELRGDNLDLTARMREMHTLCDEHGDLASQLARKLDRRGGGLHLVPVRGRNNPQSIEGRFEFS